MENTPYLFISSIIIPPRKKGNPFLLTGLSFWAILAVKGCVFMEITVGMKGEVSSFVEREDTAKEVGSGSLLVYATPCMVALMEGAACEAIEEAMDETKTTVGTALNIEHISATPVGMDVRAEAVVTAVDGKVITFEIHAFDEAGEIGKGTHKRVIVPTQKFLDKAYNKL
jgi:predicted thioesterase